MERLRAAFAEGRPLWFLASLLLIFGVPLGLLWLALVVSGAPR